MDKLRAKQLIEKYRSGECTPEERAFVESAYNLIPLQREEKDGIYYEQFSDQAWENIQSKIERKQSRRRLLQYASAAAAVLLVVLGTMYLLKPEKVERMVVYQRLDDVNPGGKKAVLVLGDGRKVEIDSASERRLVQSSSNVTIKNGEAMYSHDDNAYGPKNVVNTVVTPNAGQFQLVLSDGTKVRLNAASSLSFAPTFKGQQQRVVRLSGEAYFDVAHDAQHPFIVETPKQRIQVLGTRFNVQSYPDEYAATTSLLEGSVKISTSLSPSKFLNPGQAAITAGDKTRIAAADEYADAWSKGQIRFKDADLKTILRQVSRWYDLKVIYEHEPDPEVYTGGISMKNSLSTFLKILDSRGVRYELRQGRGGKELVIK
ncbi:transmembrane sensor [Pedobacter africanus]|uniref:FecR family protein n=1 Tax=Pedobacter africanus TaxID=151894 RepID=UPI003391A14B